MNHDEILRVFRGNVTALRCALANNAGGYVYVWPAHWLAVKFNKDVCHAVSVDHATVVSFADNRSFYNGAKERAVLMERQQALINALAHATEILNNFAQQVQA